MRFTLRHILLAVMAIAILIAAWIAISKYVAYRSDLLDHRGDGFRTMQLETALGSVNEIDPKSDVNQRVQDGDHRYAGCWGEPGGPFFPGVPQNKWQRIRNSNNYWILDGTTDVLESRHHHRLIDRAWHYAERYNTILISRQSDARIAK